MRERERTQTRVQDGNSSGSDELVKALRQKCFDLEISQQPY